jgi:hypothetical protein
MKTVTDAAEADALFVKRRQIATYGMFLVFGLSALTGSGMMKAFPSWAFLAVLPLYLILFILFIRAARCTLCGSGIKFGRECRTCVKCGHVFPAAEPLIKLAGGKK